MRVVFLTEGKLAPSSRFRVQQFLEHFQNEGIECVVHYGYGDQYNRLSATKLGPAYKLLARLKRWALGLRDAHSADVLFIQRPIFPFSPLPERILHRLNPRIVFDVDDAVFLGPDSNESPARRATFDGCVDVAQRYIAGNLFLAAAGNAPEKTTVIPTVIDTDRYCPAPTSGDRQGGDSIVTIGWIGSATTLPYLDPILPALKAVRDQDPRVRVRIVCSHMPEHLAKERNFEFVPWAASSEIESIQSFDIGIMPLTPSPISLGKCGFKMIQYMAVGIPVVASPVGANVDIFNASNAGYLAESHDEWVSALTTLVNSPAQRAEQGGAARKHCIAGYSIRAVLPRYLEIFRQVSSGKNA